MIDPFDFFGEDKSEKPAKSKDEIAAEFNLLAAIARQKRK